MEKISKRDQLLIIKNTSRCAIAVLDTLDSQNAMRDVYEDYPHRAELMDAVADIRIALARLETRVHILAKGTK